MRLTHLLLLLALAAFIAPAQESVLTGKWQFQSSIAGNDSSMECTFTQKEKEIAGTCASDRASGSVSGKVEGKNVAFTFKSEYNGAPLNVEYKGAVQSASKIVGTVNVVEYGVGGEFTATQSR